MMMMKRPSTVSKRSCSVASTVDTTLSEDEIVSSLRSMMLLEKTEGGFESGFETFDEFLNYSSNSSYTTFNLQEDEEQKTNTKNVKVKRTTKSKLKQKLKTLKKTNKLNKKKNPLRHNVKKQFQRIYKNSGTIQRAISNAAALLLRGAFHLTGNIVIVAIVILLLV